jgi:hypothetical protein
MKGITIKLPEALLAELRREARARGCSVAALIRDKLERPGPGESSYDLIADLVGVLEGPGISATNDRPKFRHLWAAHGRPKTRRRR